MSAGLRRCALVALFLAGVSGPGAAQPSEAQIEAVRENCRSDFMAHCSGVPRGGQAALECLEHNSPSLTAACRQAVGAIAPAASGPHGQPQGQPQGMQQGMQQEHEGLLRQCMAELRSHCTGVMPGGGREMRCLMENRASLSPVCHEALAAAGAMR